MIFNVDRASRKPVYERHVTILTVEDLRNLAEKYAEPGYKYAALIVDFDYVDGQPLITIYDDYVE